MSIFADALVAALNPQLAAWSHSPLAVETEMHLIRSFAAKFGLPPEEADGTFTTGGAEANQTALLAALSATWPQVLTDGVRSIRNQPVFYVSSEGHHSFLKAARICGLGESAIRYARVGTDLRIDMERLRQAIREDRAKGLAPFMLVGTAGSTGAGAIDPLKELAACAREEGLWFHVDAAWGGAAVLVQELRAALDRIEQADSITFDPHKWLSISMGAGMYLTRHAESLGRVFSLTTAYMPKEADRLAICDPYSHSLQWSRRFIGLKLFLSLAAAGWNGYEQVLRLQTRMGELLRNRLVERGWVVVNQTPLPLVCFTNPKRLRDTVAHQELANAIVASGKAWISTIQLGENKTTALRACITNYRTDENDIETLINCLAVDIASRR
jgi:glutamate/tyrosine decarboxylase-like PLP-dependent enzyme